MPYAMTHLIIAMNLSEIFREAITDLPQFLLGSIAPDAVHNRENYISDYKKAAHLSVGDEPWGMISNDEEWADNVINTICQNLNSNNLDFVLGYGSHILADIYNNSAIWTPYRLAYPDEIKKGYAGLYNQECSKIEIELALTYEKRDFLWQNLRIAHGVGFAGVIHAVEIEKQKDIILNVWYKDKSRPDLSENAFITYGA